MKPTSSFNQGNSSQANIYDNLTENEEDEEGDEPRVPNWRSQPATWSDDTRMNALFAPFRRRDLNPLHYDNKMKFWKEAISSYCKENDIIQFETKHLESCFLRKNIKPKCLELVLSELTLAGTFKTRDEALKPKVGFVKTIFNKVVWSPLTWSTGYIFKQTYLSSILTYSTRVSSSPASLTNATGKFKILNWKINSKKNFQVFV